MRILAAHIPQDTVITDVGCGTGLGRALTNNEYVGIDISPENIAYCREKYDGVFLCCDAADYVRRVERVNPIFLFSLDYLDIETVQQYIRLTDRVFIAVHYNRPYLSPTSVYSGAEDVFNMIHPPDKRTRLLRLLRASGGHTFRLLDEDFYYVTIIKR